MKLRTLFPRYGLLMLLLVWCGLTFASDSPSTGPDAYIAAGAVGLALFVGKLMKEAPTSLIDNRWIPLVTQLVSIVVYLIGTHEWTVANLLMATIVATSPTGAHQGTIVTAEVVKEKVQEKVQERRDRKEDDDEPPKI